MLAQNPIRPGRDSAAGRAALERRTVHIPDVLADPEYTFGSKNIDEIRTILAVPILKGDDLLGVMNIYHLERSGRLRISRSFWLRLLPTKQLSRSTTFDY